MNEYEELNSTRDIISSLKTSTMISAQKHMINVNKLKESLTFIIKLLQYYNITNNKIIKRVFFVVKELFSSSFMMNDITNNDYIVGYLPNTQATIIDYKNENNVYNKLLQLSQDYQLEYYVLNIQTNTIKQINLQYNIEFNVKISEINTCKLYELYTILMIKYAYALGFLNLNLYKIERMQNAIDNLNEKIKYAKHKLNKIYLEKMNKFSSLLYSDEIL